MAFPNPFAGQTAQPQQPVLPRVPYKQNPMITTAALSLLGGRNINEGLANVAATAPAGMAAKSGMQQFMLAQQEREAQKAEQEARKSQMNEVMKAWPGLSPEQRALFSAQPELFGEFALKQMGGGADTKRSLVPIWGEGPDGQPMLVQPGDDGTAIQTQLPEGFTPSKGVEKIDAGTEWLLYDKQSGQVVGRQPKNVADAASLGVQGTKQGEAAANLPMVKAAANRLVSTLDAVLNDPYLPNMVGPVAGRLPNVSGRAARTQSNIDQIMGGTFLQAYNDLRGGGQITEQEGQKATAAYNRLSTTTMHSADYEDALKQFRAEVINLAKIAEAKATAAPTLPGGTVPSAPISMEEWLGQNP